MWQTIAIVAIGATIVLLVLVIHLCNVCKQWWTYLEEERKFFALKMKDAAELERDFLDTFFRFKDEAGKGFLRHYRGE